MLDELGKRGIVLFYAISLESHLSSGLRMLLGIDENKSTISFGGTGKALSLENKVYLLMDMDIINPDLRWKLKTFLEIRNQFMHNLDAKTYIDCFNFADIPKTKLFETYLPGETVNIDDEKYGRIITKLSMDLINSLWELMNEVFTRGYIKGETEVKLHLYQAMQNTMDLLKKEADNSNSPDSISISHYYRVLSEEYEIVKNMPKVERRLEIQLNTDEVVKKIFPE